MLNRTILLLAAICSGCQGANRQFKYCSEKSDYKLNVDLQDLVIRISDRADRSRDSLKIQPCNEDPRYCVTGDISIVNPFAKNNLPKGKYVKVKFNEDRNFASVQIFDNRNIIKYNIYKENIIPEKFEFYSTTGFANGKYYRCEK